MSIDSTWFRCPNCFGRLSEMQPGVLGCDAGHRFDVSKHGTVTLLPPRAPHTVGDSRQMLDARTEFLASGAFDAIADAVVDASETAAVTSPTAPRIVDLGCGTGHYSERLATRFPGASVLVADRSPIAVRMASRLVPNSTGVILDLWRPLPIRDAAADLAINVFAPRNADEFARILRPGGTLVVVVPTDRHLQELRMRGGMLEIPTGKAEHVTAQLAPAGFSSGDVQRVEYSIAPTPAQARAIVAMGPSAHHGESTDTPDDANRATGFGDPGLGAVTVSVDVLRFHRS